MQPPAFPRSNCTFYFGRCASRWLIVITIFAENQVVYFLSVVLLLDLCTLPYECMLLHDFAFVAATTADADYLALHEQGFRSESRSTRWSCRHQGMIRRRDFSSLQESGRVPGGLHPLLGVRIVALHGGSRSPHPTNRVGFRRRTSERVSNQS